jgi:hypothetical protein
MIGLASIIGLSEQEMKEPDDVMNPKEQNNDENKQKGIV